MTVHWLTKPRGRDTIREQHTREIRDIPQDVMDRLAALERAFSELQERTVRLAATVAAIAAQLGIGEAPAPANNPPAPSVALTVIRNGDMVPASQQGDHIGTATEALCAALQLTMVRVDQKVAVVEGEVAALNGRTQQALDGVDRIEGALSAMRDAARKGLA